MTKLVKDKSLRALAQKANELKGTFNTNVTITGTDLSGDELRQAIVEGVSEAQLKTVRDITSQGQSSIAE